MTNKYEEMFGKNGEKITIRNSLTLQETIGFVKEAADMCFTEDGEYLPEVKDFAFMVEVATFYCGMPKVETVDDIDSLYAYFESIGFRSIITSYIAESQYKHLYDSVEKRIEYTCKKNIANVEGRVNKLIESVGALVDKFNQMFDGIDSGDIENLVKAMGNTEAFDEETIVKAFLDAKK